MKTTEFEKLIDKVKDNKTVIYLFERDLKRNVELYGDAKLNPEELTIEQLNNRHALLVDVEKESAHIDRLKGHANLFTTKASKKHKLSSDLVDEAPLSSDKENSRPLKKKLIISKPSTGNKETYSESFVIPIVYPPNTLNIRDQNPDANYEEKAKKIDTEGIDDSIARKISFANNEVLKEQLKELKDIRKIGTNPFNIGTHNPTGKIVIRDPRKINILIPRSRKPRSEGVTLTV